MTIDIDTAKWRTCTPLLPDGGCEAVRMLCDEIDRLRASWNCNDCGESEQRARRRAAEVEAQTAERIAAWLESPCPCGESDCESKYRAIAEAVRAGAWRKESP